MAATNDSATMRVFIFPPGVLEPRDEQAGVKTGQSRGGRRR